MRRTVVAVIVLALLTIAAATSFSDGGSSRPEVHVPVEYAPTGSSADPAAAVATAVAVDGYVTAVRTAELADQVGSYIVAVQAQELAEAQAALARQRTPVVNAPARSSTPVTGACGGATNGADQFIARESGGDPNVWNTGGSGAWGCYQIMPGTWAGAGCDELGAHGSASAAAQAQCASRLSLSAWNL